MNIEHDDEAARTCKLEAAEMDIDTTNLTEKVIEDWLYRHPILVRASCAADVERWIARQCRLPSGIADLIGVVTGARLVVVEVKNEPVTKAAILQVLRYKRDIYEMSRLVTAGYAEVHAIVIGTQIDMQTYLEAAACNVQVSVFTVESERRLSLQIVDLQMEEWQQIRYKTLAQQPEWQEYKQVYKLEGGNLASPIASRRMPARSRNRR
jgi:hypothetical protein